MFETLSSKDARNCWTFTDDGIAVYAMDVIGHAERRKMFIHYGAISSITLNFAGVLNINKNFAMLQLGKADKDTAKVMMSFIKEKSKTASSEIIYIQGFPSFESNVEKCGSSFAKSQYIARNTTMLTKKIGNQEALEFYDPEVQEFLKKYPGENAIVNKVLGLSVKEFNDSENLKSMLCGGGVRLLMCWDDQYSKYKTQSCVVFTSKMIFLHNAAKNENSFYFVPNLHGFISRMSSVVIKESTYHSKQSSVTGSAVAGGIIAGPVGALVGAVAASNSNAHGGRTVAGPKQDLGNRAVHVRGLVGVERGTVSTIYAAKGSGCPAVNHAHASGCDYSELEYINGIPEEKYNRFAKYIADLCQSMDAAHNK
ncbi:MAG: hypothetical protein ACOX7F_04770 [Eubacteriales bacterium]